MKTVCLLSMISACIMVYSATYSLAEELIPYDAGIVFTNTRLGFKVFEKLYDKNSDKNIIISPTSIAIALEMAYNGSRGETKKAMAEALELQDIDLQELNQANSALMKNLGNFGTDIQFSIANSLWGNKDMKFEPDFVKQSNDFYQANLNNLDFSDPPASEKAINKWVSEKTQKKITSVVDAEDITQDTVLFLINAAYFKGKWSDRFAEDYTRERDFTLLDGNKKKVPTMISSSVPFDCYVGDGFEAVRLPYNDGNVNMYIFVPARNSSLRAFLKNLNVSNWKNWLSQLKKQEAMIFLPKFRSEYEIKLNNALIALGLGVAFTNKADFRGICKKPCFIGEVKHKTALDVDEKGTEASASTSVKLKKGFSVYVDRPFFFAIRDDKTGAILFMGSIVEP